MATPIDNYKEVHEQVASLTADFVNAAVMYRMNPTPQEKADYETKAAFVRFMYETIKLMNNVVYNIENGQNILQPTQRKPQQPITHQLNDYPTFRGKRYNND